MRDCLNCGARWSDDTVTCPNDGTSLVDATSDPYIQQPVGSYVVTRLLGRGGMGAVYEAQHPSIGSRVAVKFLHRQYAADQSIVDRFFNEARAVNIIAHDNIVRVSDFSRLPDGSPFFIMEFLDGRPLTALIDEVQPLSLTGPIFLQIAEGLLAAHEKGIIHRDLKPDNIFLVTRGRRANFVKIVDFGIAKLQGADAGVNSTQAGMVMGTAQYMSPEQASGEVTRISAASDVYSLGIIMYQLATGQLPFDDGNFGDILVGHLTRQPQAPRSIEPSIPECYEQIILRCLEKKPEDRFASMHELFDALGDALDKEGLSRDLPAAYDGARSDGGTDSTPPIAFNLASGPPRVPSPAPVRATDEVNGYTVAASATPAPSGTMLVGGSNNAAATPGPSGTILLGANGSPVASTPPTPQKSKTPLIVAAVACAGIAAGAFFFFAPTTAPEPLAVASAEPVPAEPVPAEPAEPATLELTIATTPAGAKLALTQGTSEHTETTPTTLTLTSDEPVTFTLTADGYEPMAVAHMPRETTTLSYALVATAPPVKPAAAAPPQRAARRQPTARATQPRAEKKEVLGDGIVDVDF